MINSYLNPYKYSVYIALMIVASIGIFGIIYLPIFLLAGILMGVKKKSFIIKKKTKYFTFFYNIIILFLFFR